MWQEGLDIYIYIYLFIYLSIYLFIYTHTIYSIYRLVPASGTTWGGGGGVGWDVNVHVTLRQDVNVHEPRKPELGW